jgi:uncharacterized integral membrane protein
MSTIDIEEEAAAATDALLNLSEAGKKAAKKRKKEIKDARKRQAEIDYAARLARRAEQDKIDEAEEILSQIDPDLPDPAPVPPVDVTPPVEPPAQPEPAQVEPPEEPPAQPDAQTVVLDQAPEPQEAIGLPPAQDVPQRQHWFDPRGWNLLQWLLAILLGIVTLYIGFRTVSWATSDWNVDWPEGFVMFLSVVFGIVWVIVFAAVGFFGGALLGYRIPQWRERRRVRLNAAAPVPPVPAVPPANPPAA